MRFVLGALAVLFVAALGFLVIGSALLNAGSVIHNGGIWGVLAVLALPLIGLGAYLWDRRGRY